MRWKFGRTEVMAIIFFLAVNMEPNSTDLSPLPATGAVWKYKAIYCLHVQQVGQWSDVITVAVGV